MVLLKAEAMGLGTEQEVERERLKVQGTGRRVKM